MKFESLRPFVRIVPRGVAFLFLAAACAVAKPPGKNEGPPPVDVRVLPLGDAPRLVMHVEDGRYVQTPYKPGEAPPSVFYVADRKDPKPLPLGLNRARLVPGGVKAVGKITLATKGPGEGDPVAPWCEAPVPKDCRRLLVMLSAETPEQWNRPVVRTLDISPDRLPGPGVHLLNAGTLPLMGELGGVRVDLMPGQSLFVPSEKLSGPHTPFRCASVFERGYSAEIDRTVAVPADSVDFLVIYPCKTIPGRRVAVCEFSERTPAPGGRAVAANP